MRYGDLKKKFQDRKGSVLGKYFKAAVLVPLLELNGEVNLLFEVRASHLAVQPGEISFPGGGVEKGETFLEAAVRETEEELCLKREQIEIFGKLDYMVSPFNLIIAPFAGWLSDINAIEEISYNKDEVGKIFAVPLKFLLNSEPAKHSLDVLPSPKEDFPYNLIENGREYKWNKGNYPVYFYQYQDYVIWGITARILHNFLEICREE